MATIGGFAILDGTLQMPAFGAWSAQVRLDSSSELPTTVRAVSVDLDGQTLVGTVERQGVYAGVLEARVVGGAGGIVPAGALARTVTAKAYRKVPARIVVADLLSSAGEVLSAAASNSALSVQLAAWHRHAGTAGAAWRRLMLALGTAWKVQPDGSIWFGSATWPSASAPEELLRDGGHGVVTYSPDAALLPGTTVNGVRVGAVVYTFTDASVRAEAWAA